MEQELFPKFALFPEFALALLLFLLLLEHFFDVSHFLQLAVLNLIWLIFALLEPTHRRGELGLSFLDRLELSQLDFGHETS